MRNFRKTRIPFASEISWYKYVHWIKAKLLIKYHFSWRNSKAKKKILKLLKLYIFYACKTHNELVTKPKSMVIDLKPNHYHHCIFYNLIAFFNFSLKAILRSLWNHSGLWTDKSIAINDKNLPQNLLMVKLEIFYEFENYKLLEVISRDQRRSTELMDNLQHYV